VKSSALRAAFLSLISALGLTACLSGDAPNLSVEDLTEPVGFGGAYSASAVPEDLANGQNAVRANVEAIGERTYRLTFTEGQRKDAPVLLRMLALNDGTLLGVVTDPDPAKGALFAIVTRASNGAWVFRNIDFKADRRGRILRDALMRHGAASVDFGTGDFELNRIKGNLTAANLRALFSDSDFARALEMDRGFRLSPMTPVASVRALD
jgi:hypothetical protein